MAYPGHPYLLTLWYYMPPLETPVHHPLIHTTHRSILLLKNLIAMVCHPFLSYYSFQFRHFALKLKQISVHGTLFLHFQWLLIWLQKPLTCSWVEDGPNTLSISNLLQLPWLSTDRAPSSSASALTTTVAADPDSYANILVLMTYFHWSEPFTKV